MPIASLFAKALLMSVGLLIATCYASAAEPPKTPPPEDGAALATVTVPDPLELDAETKCLALAVYWEGRAESKEGRLAIAHTVMNRVGHKEFPDSICGVVAQKSENGKSCQFSWWCDGKHDAPQDDEGWDKAVATAQSVRNRSSHDPSKGALFFHSVKVRPNWEKHQRIGRIGNHIFYR